ncbi:MAG TPA: hypothetical protein VFW86_03380 [Candidatus Limnocylindrales bacterium]|jgi:hypothetical protein|nr:hypothetical protein [Candidatus Limnocylindrales bacterium]
MDHAETLERLESSALGPGGVEALETDRSAQAQAVKDHLAGCFDCRAEYDSLATTRALLAAAAPDDLAAPPEARERVLRAVRETGVRRPVRPMAVVPDVSPAPMPTLQPPSTALQPRRGFRRLWPALAMAAAVIIVAAGVLLGLDLTQQRDTARDQAAALSRVTALTDRLLAEPDARTVVLHDSAGQSSGSVLFSATADQLVVFTQSLDADAPAQAYACYVERDGRRTRIGWMNAAGNVSYWMGPVPGGLGQAGDRFVVEGDEPGAQAALSGTF